MFADNMKASYRRSRWSLGLRGLVGMIVGIFIVARPLESVAAFALVIALWAVIDGIVNIVHAFHLRSVVRHWWVLLLGGIVSVIFGCAALYYYPVLSLGFAVLWVSFWLVISGGLGISFALLERRVGLPWGWAMALALLTIVLGFVAVAYPGITLLGLMGLLAGYGIVGGIVLLVDAASRPSSHPAADQAARGAAGL